MQPKTQASARWRQSVLAVAMATAAAGAAPQVDTTAAPAPAVTHGLRDLFEAAWARQPEALALPVRRDAVQALRRVAEAWTPEPPAVEASHRTDRLTPSGGAREAEVGVAIPLWLPGERRGSATWADAQASALESRASAARLRLAATVRQAWWSWQRAAVELELARGQLASARRIAADVTRRALAGELARADQHQAGGALAAAEAAAAQAQANLGAALQEMKALADIAPAGTPATAAAEPEPTAHESRLHPVLADMQDQSTVAEQAASLAIIQSRAHPELTLATTRDRGAAGERPVRTVTLAVRIPLGGGPRHDSLVASARADAIEARARLALDRARLQSELDAALARVDGARVQLAAAERRSALASQTRGFFEKAFRLGESDLPTQLRVEAEAAEAERQAARSRIELSAAISAWRQALGLLPQ